MYEETDKMEMPTPCQHCGEWFDLNDGCHSVKWYPNTIICEKCGDKEEKIIELEDELEDIKINYENAKWDVDHYGKRIKEIEEELKKLDSPDNQK
jgi:hypothetical protein